MEWITVSGLETVFSPTLVNITGEARMRTRSRMRLGWSAAWALALVCGAPALASAQTTELFPFRTITRERVPCAMEDPVYKLYRNEYFGYHPTCWRKFPTGWGCPSPEGPDAVESFRKLPRDKPESAEPIGDDPAPEGGAGMRGGRGALPPLPAGDRSPFDLESAPGPATPPAGNPAETKPAPGPGAGEPPVTAPEANMPAVPAAPREAESETSQPILALPDPTVAPSSALVNSGPDAAVMTPPARTHAPRRTSVIGNLLSGIGLRRR